VLARTMFANRRRRTVPVAVMTGRLFGHWSDCRAPTGGFSPGVGDFAGNVGRAAIGEGRVHLHNFTSLSSRVD
jgi:hypothetical protein